MTGNSNQNENLRNFLVIVVICSTIAVAWFSRQGMDMSFLSSKSGTSTPIPISEPTLVYESASDPKNSDAVTVLVVSPTETSESFDLLLTPQTPQLSGLQLRFSVDGVAAVDTQQQTTSSNPNGLHTAVSSVSVHNNTTTVELSYRTTPTDTVASTPMRLATITLKKKTKAPLHLNATQSKAFTIEGRELPVRFEYP